MMRTIITGLAAAALMAATTPALAQPVSSFGEEAGIPATQEELAQARGGWVWAVFIVGARVSTLAIKYCGGTKTAACAHKAIGTFNSYNAAKAFVCRRTGKLC